MTRLRELRLHGFKTFADPTTFVFEAGVNAVIGPNGSGKSNMADAVRWVLGEQSNRFLRTRRSEDVIFAGSEWRRPQGMAEAVLTLDNSDRWLPIDFGEVTIGRRAYRSGEGEYLLNGAKVRLRDIAELLEAGRLGANSLVVVGQGTVDAALSLRPEERRQLFEEAAGVKGLQVRRNEATVRLTRARDNLSRVTDLLGELRPQVRRLALQAQHQQEHDQLGRRARALVIDWHRRRERAIRADLGEARRRAAAAETDLERVRGDLAAGRDALAAAESAYWEAESRTREAATAREAAREEVIRAEMRLEALAQREAALAAELSAGERLLAEHRRALDEHRRAVAEVSTSAATDEAPSPEQQASAEARWQAASAELASADAALLEAEQALADGRRREADRVAEEGRRRASVAAAAARRAQQEEHLAQARAAEQEAGKNADHARAVLQRAREAAERAEATRSAAEQEVAAAEPIASAGRRRAGEIAERAGALGAELGALRERSEHRNRLGSTLVAAGWSALLDALDAPDAAWAAIEALVGGELEQVLLWGDAAVGPQLAEARGSARFLLTGESAPDAGERRTALRAVQADRTLAEWVGRSDVPALFHRTAVAPDLDRLLAGWRALPAGWAAVTPQGDLADARGLVALRGRAEQAGSEAVRLHAQRAELEQLVAELEREHEQASAAAARAVAALAAARRRLELAQAPAAETRRGGLEAEASAEAAEARLALARRELEELERGLGEAPPASAGEPAGEPAREPIPLESLQEAVAAATRERERAAAAREAARAERDEARRSAEALDASGSAAGGDRLRLEMEVARVEASLPGQRQALAELAEQRANVEQALAEARRREAAANAARDQADRERGRLRGELLEVERSSGTAAARLAELERAAQAAAVEESRQESALAAIERERELALDGLAEAGRPGEDEARALAEELSGLDDPALEGELRRVRRTLAQIGSVNPFAVEEHRELAARLEGLSGQEGDLRQAIEGTGELIARLDGEIAERFDAAFAAIGERFDEFARLLFAGGSASLQKEEAADGGAAGGIEIVVRPPGKRLQRLAMLSGGERALTGVALLFAMLSVNPVPFCILDEVDAALDEANIGRFADALRRLSESIDFVVITHNRATIETADTIYGVTMTDAAVSRVLSLRLSDVAAEVSA